MQQLKRFIASHCPGVPPSAFEVFGTTPRGLPVPLSDAATVESLVDDLLAGDWDAELVLEYVVAM